MLEWSSQRIPLTVRSEPRKEPTALSTMQYLIQCPAQTQSFRSFGEWIPQKIQIPLSPFDSWVQWPKPHCSCNWNERHLLLLFAFNGSLSSFPLHHSITNFVWSKAYFIYFTLPLHLINCTSNSNLHCCASWPTLLQANGANAHLSSDSSSSGHKA